MFQSVKTILLLIAAVACTCCMPACKKFLNEKQDQTLVTPETLRDLQAILDNYFNNNVDHPGAGELSADDYYLTYETWQNRDEHVRRMYRWETENIFVPNTSNDWVICYTNVYKANVVLYNLPAVRREPGDEADWNNTKGSALFLRAISFAQIAWIWSLAYDETKAAITPGIPLRLDPNFNTRSVRASLQETYDRIINDLKEAAPLLPVTPVHVLRPSQPAAYGWLARTYLTMRMYDSARVYADKCLTLYDELMDYNLLDASSTGPIESYNPEVIYHSTLNKPLSTSSTLIDSVLYRSYAESDLRKHIFFRTAANAAFRFKGSYDGTNNPGGWFNGIATDEMFLIRAECYARSAQVTEALQDLNTLMIKRWKNDGSWVPFTAASAADALSIILQERRKEVTERGLRWMDIKRLNLEGAGIELKRVLNGEIVVLPPNDPRYALPIPSDVIALTGMQQN